MIVVSDKIISNYYYMKKDKFLLAYIAGLWDGEGSFMLIRTGKVSPRTGMRECVATAQICMAINGRQEKVLKLLKEMYDGCLFEIKDPPSKNMNAKSVIMWRVAAQKARLFAKDLLPYLRMKKRQAEILIEYTEIKERNRKAGSRWTVINEKERQLLVDEIHTLNHRGKI